MPRQLKDAKYSVTTALPNGAATVASAGQDLDITTNADFQAGVELLIEAPALATADLPDTETMTYDVYHDTASGFGSETLLAGSVLIQTGAGGAGDAAASVRVALPSDVKRYIRVKATNSGAGDASDKDMTTSLVF